MNPSRSTPATVPLLPAALAFAGMNLGAAILGAPGPRPDSSASAVSEYLIANSGRVSLLGVLVLVTAIPLMVWAAGTYSRLRQLAPGEPGPAIALAGGLLASMSLVACGLVTWTSADTAELGDVAVSRMLSTMSFAFGGPGFVAMLGLLLAGTAISGMLIGLLPRPVAWAGLGLAVISVVSVTSLLTQALVPLVPVGRFGGAIWLVVVASLLEANRRRVGSNQGAAS